MQNDGFLDFLDDDVDTSTGGYGQSMFNTESCLPVEMLDLLGNNGIDLVSKQREEQIRTNQAETTELKPFLDNYGGNVNKVGNFGGNENNVVNYGGNFDCGGGSVSSYTKLPANEAIATATNNNNEPDNNVDQLLQSMFGDELKEMLGQHGNQDDSGIGMLDDLIQELEQPEQKGKENDQNLANTNHQPEASESSGSSQSVPPKGPPRFEGAVRFKAKPAFLRCLESPERPKEEVPKPFQIPIPTGRKNLQGIVSVDPTILEIEGLVEKTLNEESDCEITSIQQPATQQQQPSPQPPQSVASTVMKTSEKSRSNNLKGSGPTHPKKYSLSEKLSNVQDMLAKRMLSKKLKDLKAKSRQSGYLRILPKGYNFNGQQSLLRKNYLNASEPQNRIVEPNLLITRSHHPANLKTGPNTITNTYSLPQITDNYPISGLMRSNNPLYASNLSSLSSLNTSLQAAQRLTPSTQGQFLQIAPTNTKPFSTNFSHTGSLPMVTYSSYFKQNQLRTNQPQGAVGTSSKNSSAQSSHQKFSSSTADYKTKNSSGHQCNVGKPHQNQAANRNHTRNQNQVYTGNSKANNSSGNATAYQQQFLNYQQQQQQQNNQINPPTNSSLEKYKSNFKVNNLHQIQTQPVTNQGYVIERKTQVPIKDIQPDFSRNQSMLNRTPWCNKNFYPQNKECKLASPPPGHKCNFTCQNEIQVQKEIIRYPASHFINIFKDKKKNLDEDMLPEVTDEICNVDGETNPRFQQTGGNCGSDPDVITLDDDEDIDDPDCILSGGEETETQNITNSQESTNDVEADYNTTTTNTPKIDDEDIQELLNYKYVHVPKQVVEDERDETKMLFKIFSKKHRQEVKEDSSNQVLEDSDQELPDV